MNQECEHTRQALARYLQGHLFRPRKNRIDRHLRSCPLCRSEFEAMKRVEETRRLLKDISPAEGVLQRLQEGLRSLAGLKKLFYRPLWTAGAVTLAAAVLAYLFLPGRTDIELEHIMSSAPTVTMPALPASAPLVSAPLASIAVSTPPAPEAGVPRGGALKKPAETQADAEQPVPTGEPLLAIITVTKKNEQPIIQFINREMRALPRLKKKRFSDRTREISVSLTAGELRSFLERIEATGTVDYDAAALRKAASSQPVPFTMRLQGLSKPVEKAPAPQPAPAAEPVRTPAPEEPVSSPAATPPEPSPQEHYGSPYAP